MKLEAVYGIHAVTTLLQRSADQVVEVWVQKGRHDNRMQRLLAMAEEQGLSVMDVDKGLLNQKVEGNHTIQHQNERRAFNGIEQIGQVFFRAALRRFAPGDDALVITFDLLVKQAFIHIHDAQALLFRYSQQALHAVVVAALLYPDFDDLIRRTLRRLSAYCRRRGCASGDCAKR